MKSESQVINKRYALECYMTLPPKPMQIVLFNYDKDFKNSLWGSACPVERIICSFNDTHVTYEEATFICEMLNRKFLGRIGDSLAFKKPAEELSIDEVCFDNPPPNIDKV